MEDDVIELISDTLVTVTRLRVEHDKLKADLRKLRDKIGEEIHTLGCECDGCCAIYVCLEHVDELIKGGE